MAARDFEDLLQVSVGIFTNVISLNMTRAIVFYSSFCRAVARSCQDRFSRSETDADRDARLTGEHVACGG